jgi:hypothetical protein
MNDTLTKGTVVRYKDGWMEVRAVFKNTVNLGSIFGSKTKIKGVPKSDVKPDYEAWHEAWTKSETYASM